GEFAFVLYAAAEAAGVIEGRTNDSMTAIVVLSMVLTPLVALAMRPLLRETARPSLDGVDVADGQTGSVLIIGFGRFGQVMSQSLLARDVDVTIINNDIEMIRNASKFGFQVYYGDGRRLDVLHASGAGSARAIAVCVNDPAGATRIVRLARRQFPQAKLLVRAYARQHALTLVNAGAHLQVRETFGSAVAFGEAALRALGVDADEAAAISAQVRRLDAERFELEVASNDPRAGARLVIGNSDRNAPRPTPFVPPRRASRALNAEAEEAAP